MPEANYYGGEHGRF